MENSTDIPTTLAGMLALSNRIEHMIAEAGGEITQEIERLLKATEINQPAKIDSTVFVLKRMESAEEMFRAEADRYTKVARGLAKAYKQLFEYVKTNMNERGMRELEGNSNKFTLYDGAGRIEVALDLLPDLYSIPIISKEANMDLIKQALARGETIPGVTLHPTKSMRISAAKKVKEKSTKETS